MEESNEVYDTIVKITLIGDAAVGKTNLLSMFIDNKFDINRKSTVGVEVASKIVNLNESKIKLIMWDTAGQEKYKAITNSFYTNSKGALIIFDITRPKSLESVTKWIEEYKIVAGNENIIIIGNKKDLTDLRKISEEEATKQITELGYKYVETSALTGENVEFAFELLVDLINQNYLSKMSMMSDNENKENDEEKKNELKISLVDHPKKADENCSC